MTRNFARTILLVALAAGAASAQLLPVTCTPSALPQTVGSPVSIKCTANGIPPYSWSISTGSLPPGLMQDTSSGDITGTLTDPAGPYSFIVTATDSSLPILTGSQAYSGATVDPLTVSCVPPPPNGGPVEAALAYMASCTASGGTSPFTWSLTGSAIPNGMAVTPSANTVTATVTDTPASPAASYNYQVSVTDSSSTPLTAATASYSGAIAPAVTITTTTLPAAAVGSAYSQQLMAGGGVTPYSWSATGLSNGLSLSTTGLLTGTPTTATAVNFTATVTDSVGGMAMASLSVTVNPALTITTASPLPPATIGTAYSQQLAASGGNGTYTFSQTGLPAWLTLSPAGALTGTPPTNAVTVTFQATVTDGAGNASAPAPLTVPVTLAITTTSPLAVATVGKAYNHSLTAGGGAGGYSFAVTTGSLPMGLSLSTAGAITGTPTATAVTTTFSVTVTDSSNATAQATFTLPVKLQITTASPLPPGTINVPYSQTLTVVGGAGAPYTWSVTGGGLPNGVQLDPASGMLAGIPGSSGTFTFTVQVTDSASLTASTTYTLVIAGALTITTAPTLPTATAGTLYSQTLAAAGGAPPYSWALASGSTLPSGLSLSTAGLLSGTPSAAGAASFTIQVTDSAKTTATKAFTLSIASALSITTTSPLPTGEIGVSYSQTLAATGGTAPYTWSITLGSLPSGLNLAPSGLISGAPGVATTVTFTAQATDSNSVTASRAFTVTIAPAVVISTGTDLIGGAVGATYSETLSASFGVPPYNWSVVGAGLPPGLSVSSAGAITGTPTAGGNFSFTGKVADSLGGSATRQFNISIGTGLTVTSPTTLPGASTGIQYTSTLLAAGGNQPYSWAITAGALPGGLSLAANGTISGTPSSPGTFTFTVQVTDSTSHQASKQLMIVVTQALHITTSTLPGGNLGATYSQTLAASGGTPAYTWLVVSGALPTGLALSPAGVISGTLSAAGTFTFSVQVTDSLQLTAKQQFAVTVTAGLTIQTPATLASGSVGTSYSQSLVAAGGTPPYSWTLVSGTLPPGLSLASAGSISGKPTTAGNSSFKLQVADHAGATASRTFTIGIVNGLTITTPPTLPSANDGVAYSQTLSAAGGSTPYSWSLTSGVLPAGLSLSSAGVLGGTPSSGGSYTFTISVKDQVSNTASQQFTLIVAGPSITTAATLPNGKVGTPYSQTLAATGTAPFTWATNPASLAPGLSLSSGGTLSGTPSKAGSYSFTVQVTDATSLTASQTFTLVISNGLTVTSGTLPSAVAGTSYSQTLTATGGTAPYTWALTQGALPAGLSLNSATGVISGTPTVAGTFTATVQATDSTQATGSANISVVVVLPAAPSASFAGVQATAPPASQLTNLGLTLGSAYPIPISGQVTLTFQSSAKNAADDPAIMFSNGSRTASFTIAANSTTATFAGAPLDLQTGTVAGTITLAVTWQAGGATLSGGPNQTIQIAAAAPVITAVSASSNSGGFTVSITGYSTTRDVTQALLQFTAAAGQSLQTTSLTVSLESASTAWFGGSGSDPYGSQFVLSMPFTVSNGSASAISSVSVQLVNSTGSSNTMSASLQ